jgi:hypothetical protein
MSRASRFIAAVWPLVRTSKPSGLWPIRRDPDLVRPGAAVTDLDARLLAGEAPPGLSEARDVLLDLWRRTIEDAAPIRARALRCQQIKTTMLLAVMRETRTDSPVRDLVQSVTRDLTERHATERVSEAFSCEPLALVLALTALGAALDAPTPEAAKRRHHASWTNRRVV